MCFTLRIGLQWHVFFPAYGPCQTSYLSQKVEDSPANWQQLSNAHKWSTMSQKSVIPLFGKVKFADKTFYQPVSQFKSHPADPLPTPTPGYPSAISLKLCTWWDACHVTLWSLANGSFTKWKWKSVPHVSLMCLVRILPEAQYLTKRLWLNLRMLLMSIDPKSGG